MSPPRKDSVEPKINELQNVAESSDPTVFAVFLGPIGYKIARLSIQAFHVVCALAYFGTAVLFHEVPDTYLFSYLQGYKMILTPRLFPGVAITHFIIGAIHTYFVFAPLLRVVIGTRRRRRASSPRIWASRLPFDAQRRAVSKAVGTMYTRVFSRHGFLGIESPYFDGLQLIREIVECSLQANQAYQMSQLLSRWWLNRLYVGILVINCWITPALHLVVTAKPLRRLLDRILDIVLDFATSVGVPLVLISNYWHVYDPTIRDFPQSLWLDNLWTVRLQHESPMVFFCSPFDAACCLMFSVGLLTSLHSVKSVLRQRSSKLRPASHSGRESFIHPTRVQAWKALSLIHPTHVEAKKPAAPSKPHVSHGAKAHRLAHCWLIGLGAFVLIAHLHSELRTPPLACRLELRPWFVAKPTCVDVEINCLTQSVVSDSGLDFDRVFKNLDAATLVQVGIRDCHAISVQPSLQQFFNLANLSFCNATIVTWPAHAAVTTTFHPQLRILQFVHTNFTNRSLPGGILARDFPTSVGGIFFSFTNLASIPDDLDVRWPRGLALVFEFCRLTEYPRVLARLQASSLMLFGNAITEIPAAAFEVSGQSALGLSGNPISSLPENVDPTLLSQPSSIALDYTNVSVVPTWLLDAAASGMMFVSASRTPYCVALAAGRDESEAKGTISPVDCTDNNPENGFYQAWGAGTSRQVDLGHNSIQHTGC